MDMEVDMKVIILRFRGGSVGRGRDLGVMSMR